MKYLRELEGGGANKHWLVESAGQKMVLRRYQREPIGDVDYELRVLQRLATAGWPVPVATAEPYTEDGHIWCLFEYLPGTSKAVDDKRARGRLLATLHNDLAQQTDLGQRKGCARADEVVADPALTEGLRAYSKIFPEEARIMQWHATRAQELFADVDCTAAEQIVLHGDLINQNLLYEQEKLTGIIDFEATHLNFRVSDFALTWRGRDDDVIHGYEEIHPLTEVDWKLLAPAWWSWAFLGVAKQLGRILSGDTKPHRFEWQVRVLQRRSALMSC